MNLKYCIIFLPNVGISIIKPFAHVAFVLPKLSQTTAPLFPVFIAYGYYAKCLYSRWGGKRKSRSAVETILQMVFMVSNMSSRRSYWALDAMVQVSRFTLPLSELFKNNYISGTIFFCFLDKMPSVPYHHVPVDVSIWMWQIL